MCRTTREINRLRNVFTRQGTISSNLIWRRWPSFIPEWIKKSYFPLVSLLELENCVCERIRNGRPVATQQGTMLQSFSDVCLLFIAPSTIFPASFFLCCHPVHIDRGPQIWPRSSRKKKKKKKKGNPEDPSCIHAPITRTTSQVNDTIGNESKRIVFFCSCLSLILI